MQHIGLLYCMDHDKDGRFYLEDLQAFGQEVVEQIKKLQTDKQDHELEQQIRSFCTLQLWKSVYGQSVLMQDNNK